MNTMPVKAKRKLSFTKFINSLKLNRTDKKAQELISLLRKHPKFSVDKSEFVKFSTYFILEKDSDMCVFFADCDNLRIANEIANQKAEQMNLETAKKMDLQDVSFLENPVTGEELVDNDIELLLSQIKDINKKYNYENALIGVSGDEIFITIPHLKEEDKQKIYSEYSQVHSGFITISVRAL